MIEVYGTTFARITEIKRGMLVRRLTAFHVVVDVRLIEDDATRLWLDDGSTITLGGGGLVEVARRVAPAPEATRIGTLTPRFGSAIIVVRRCI
jgi:hypothetical protein